MRRAVISGAAVAILIAGLCLRLTAPHKPPALHPEQFARGECTWYVYQRTQDFGWRVRFDQPYGRHARAWWERAVNVARTDTPCEHSVMVLDAWRGNPYGHVAFVERVESSTKWVISHANWALGRERERRAEVPVYVAKVERMPGGLRIEGMPHVFSLRGFLSPINAAHMLARSGQRASNTVYSAGPQWE